MPVRPVSVFTFSLVASEKNQLKKSLTYCIKRWENITKNLDSPKMAQGSLVQNNNKNEKAIGERKKALGKFFQPQDNLVTSL